TTACTRSASCCCNQRRAAPRSTRRSRSRGSGTRNEPVYLRLPRGPFRIGLASLVLGFVCGPGARAEEGATPAREAPSPRRGVLAEMVSKRHLVYALLGAAGTWAAFEGENAAAVARTLEHTPGDDVASDFGNVYGSATTLAA